MVLADDPDICAALRQTQQMLHLFGHEPWGAAAAPDDTHVQDVDGAGRGRHRGAAAVRGVLVNGSGVTRGLQRGGEQRRR